MMSTFTSILVLFFVILCYSLPIMDKLRSFEDLMSRNYTKNCLWMTPSLKIGLENFGLLENLGLKLFDAADCKHNCYVVLDVFFYFYFLR